MAKNFRSPAKILRRLRLAPLAMRKIKTWPRFMCNYALGLVPLGAYEFRNGARIRIGRGVDHVPMIEIFLREEYGVVPDGAIVLDFGANIGAFSIYAATNARNVTVYAYEPMPGFFRLLQDNIRLNRAEDMIKAFNCAVGASTQPRELFTQGKGFLFPTLMATESAADIEKILVPCTTLADILESNRLRQVGLLKMDCEGAEYEILYETPASYFDRIERIRMEYHDLTGEGCNRDDLLEFLRSRNYRIVRNQANAQGNGIIWAHKV
jgi:FkbM family methyltransferase